MKVVNLSETNSVLNQYLREIRDVDTQKDPMRFRRNIERIGEFMAMELSKTLAYTPTRVQTPLGVAEVNTIAEPLVLATILRAGLPLHQGFLNVFDRAENAFLSAYRRVGRNVHGEDQLEIVAEYMAAPDIEGKTLIIADPMLATGMSMEVGYLALLRHGTPKHTHLCCTIATPSRNISYPVWATPATSVTEPKYISPIVNLKSYMACLPAVLVAAGIAFVSLRENPQALLSLRMNDKVIHGLMYAVLTAALLLPAMVKGRFVWSTYLSAGMTAFLYGGLMEVLQACCTTSRSAEWADLVADGIGIVMALIITERIRSRIPSDRE